MIATRTLLLVLSLAGSALGALPAAAQTSFSGFGTVGYARSNQPFKFQRRIDENGTFERDSLFGVQMDTQLGSQWGLTLQAKLAPSTSSDSDWDPTLSWAFLSYRPSNDLLLRAGKLRVPLLLNSENTDVGTTFDFARLPFETYSLSPTTDVTGASFSKTWLGRGNCEWTLDGYAGTVNTEWRFYGREFKPDGSGPGAWFEPVDLTLAGLVGSLRTGENTYRVGLHRASAESPRGRVTANFPFVSIAPGVGFFTVTGPGVPTEAKAFINAYTLGGDIALPAGFRFIGEYVRRDATNVTTGLDSWGAYGALLKRIGAWTPYVYSARIKSSGGARELYRGLNTPVSPLIGPSAPLLTAAQRVAADSLGLYDHRSWAVGTSYSLAPTRKLKAEWLRTRIGLASSVIDAPPGEESGGRHVNVYSLSYSFTF